MKNIRYLAAVIAFMICLPAMAMAAEANPVWKVGIIPYYHGDETCTYGDFSLYSDFEIPEREKIASEVAAETMGLRPCPACASAFGPVFTGEFPDWDHEIAPWDFGGMDTYLPRDVRAAWGDAGNVIYEMVGEGPFPEDYAGRYRNASGGYTIMMVDPTPERIEKYRKTLKSEFWVMAATYSMNELRALQDDLTDIMGFDGLTINSLYVSEGCNCVVVGANDTSPEALTAIHAYMAMKGYDDPGMVILEYSEGATAVDF